jgi:hypothetical protein
MADLIVVPSPPADGNDEPGAAFIEPAPLIDVLFDQLEYLVSHTGEECPAGVRIAVGSNKSKNRCLYPSSRPIRRKRLQPDSVSRPQTVWLIV